jgi:hypothetical protein
MQLDNIFEDLEAQFDFALERRATRSISEMSNLVRLRRHDGRTLELIRPLIGSDFIAGMVLGANAFCLYRLATLIQVEFVTLQGVQLDAIKRTSFSLRDFLINVSLPSEISWSTIHEIDTMRGVVSDIFGELLMINLLGRAIPIGVPASSLAEVQIHTVENLNADS